MTSRPLDLIAAADAILYDRLIPPDALAGARPDAELRYVGNQPGGHSHSQQEINDLLVELAAARRAVVRLKGGDPFVFGRGGEEAQALAAAGIRYEVVPGVTAGVAAPAYAGIPVTHRDDSSAVAFVTARAGRPLDFGALAHFPGTLVFYMGVEALAETARSLMAAGRPATETAAVIERGTLAEQRTVSGTLGDIAERVAEAGVEPPAVTVVGAVAALRDELAWVERRPLHGRRVVVTRARAQSSGLSAKLKLLGADVVEAPAIRIEPRPPEELDTRVARIGDYALVCLTSPNGAAILLEALERAGRDARALAACVVAAIGPGTARELRRRGIRADVIPERSIAEALVEALAGTPVEGRRVLVARAAEARDVLPRALAERGADVDVLALYDTVAEQLGDDARQAAAAADYVTFTSSSTVRYFVEAMDGSLPTHPRTVSIGPVTSAAARAAGLRVDAEATRHDIDGLVDALVADATAT